MPFLRACPDFIWHLSRINNLLDPDQCAIYLTPHVKRQFLEAMGRHKRDNVRFVELEPTDVQLIQELLSGELMKCQYDDLHRAISQVCQQTRPNSPSAITLSTSLKLQLCETIEAHREIIARKRAKIADLQMLLEDLRFNKNRSLESVKTVSAEEYKLEDIEIANADME